MCTAAYTPKEEKRTHTILSSYFTMAEVRMNRAAGSRWLYIPFKLAFCTGDGMEEKEKMS